MMGHSTGSKVTRDELEVEAEAKAASTAVTITRDGDDARESDTLLVRDPSSGSDRSHDGEEPTLTRIYVRVRGTVYRFYCFAIVPFDIFVDVLNAGPTVALVVADYCAPFQSSWRGLPPIYVASGGIASSAAAFVAINELRHPESRRTSHAFWRGFVSGAKFWRAFVSATWVADMLYDMIAYVWTFIARLMGNNGQVNISLAEGLTSIVLPSAIFGTLRFIHAGWPLETFISPERRIYPYARLGATALGSKLIYIEEISNWAAFVTITDQMGFDDRRQHIGITMGVLLIAAFTALLQINRTLLPKAYVDQIERLTNVVSAAGIMAQYVLLCLELIDSLGGPIGLSIQLAVLVGLFTSLFVARYFDMFEPVSEDVRVDEETAPLLRASASAAARRGRDDKREDDHTSAARTLSGYRERDLHGAVPASRGSAAGRSIPASVSVRLTPAGRSTVG